MIFSLFYLSPWLLSGSTPAKVFANIPPIWPPDDRRGVDSYYMYFVRYMSLIVKYNAIIIISPAQQAWKDRMTNALSSYSFCFFSIAHFFNFDCFFYCYCLSSCSNLTLQFTHRSPSHLYLCSKYVHGLANTRYASGEKIMLLFLLQ